MKTRVRRSPGGRYLCCRGRRVKYLYTPYGVSSFISFDVIFFPFLIFLLDGVVEQGTGAGTDGWNW